jgi:hypothetical protein
MPFIVNVVYLVVSIDLTLFLPLPQYFDMFPSYR